MGLKLNDYYHTAVICSDCEKAKHFYVDVLGLQPKGEKYREKSDSIKIPLYLKGRYVIELFIYHDTEKKIWQSTTGYKHIAFLTEDIYGAEKALSQQKVPCTDIHTDPDTGKQYFFLYDPDGNELELYQL